MIAAVMAQTDTFEDDFLREYADVVRCAYRVLGDRVDAEDVAQDVFMRFIGRRLPESSVLRLATVRMALNALRSRKRRLARELAEYRAAMPSAPDSRALDPFTVVDAQSRTVLVRSALVQLRPRDAELLLLRYSGADYRDLAQSLYIDGAQVGMRLARAERAFRKEIDRAAIR